MNWITAIWSATAGICLTLATVYFLVWVKSRDAWANLFFAMAAVSGAAISVFELHMMQAPTPQVYDELLRWSYVPTGLMIVSIVWFIRFYLRAGNIWLIWLLCVIRALILVLTFAMDSSLHFLEITGLRQVQVLGEIVVIPVGVANPWAYWGNTSTLLLIIITLQAVIVAWRRGNHRQAAVIGSTIIGATVLGIMMSVMLAAGMLRMPYALSLVFLIIVLGMAYELSVNLIDAGKLSWELYQSRERMRLAANAANIALWEWDIRRDKVWVSEIGRAQTRTSESKSVSLDDYLQSLHPDDRAPTWRAVREAVDGGTELQAEFRMTNPNGETIWLAARGQVERDAQGKPLHLRGISIDITERKRAEMESTTLQRELSHLQRVSAIGQLSSALAHEINQPLGAILRNAEAAELFLQQTPPDLDELRAILGDIRRDEQRAISVIERMRSLLKRRELEVETLAVGELVEQVILLLHSEAQQRHVALHVEVPSGLPAVRGDRVHIQQVLMNLLLNALDAVEAPAVAHRQVCIRASQVDDEMVELAVSDRGEGIPPDRLQHLFQPFFTTKSKGTGIGLAISKAIVELHGGQILAEDNPDGGATFRFTLPVVKPGGAQ